MPLDQVQTVRVELILKPDQSSETDVHEPVSRSIRVEQVHLSKEELSKASPTHWILDTGASSPMTDQLHLFRNLRKIPKVIIQVGGGELYSTHKCTALVTAMGGSKAYVRNVYYVKGLGVSLLSVRKLCKLSPGNIHGSFDEISSSLYYKEKEILKAVHMSGIYIVDYISEWISGQGESTKVPKALPVLLAYNPSPESDVDLDDTDPEAEATKKQCHEYRLMHRRLGHCEPEVIRKIHLVTTGCKAVKIPSGAYGSCRVCKMAKMRNQISKQLSAHKPTKLELIFVDIAGPFITSLRSNRYFIEIVESWSRKIWEIPLEHKGDAIEKLRVWKKKEELATGCKLKAARTDNAPELKKILDQFEKEDGIQAQYTTIASSHQNGSAERHIQTAENNIRAMITDAELPLEFWDEAVEHDAFIRNLVARGPEVKGEVTSPEQAYTGSKPDVNNLYVWGCQSFSYVNPKTRSKHDRHDKLVHRGREGVFLGYAENTTKHMKFYAPDLGRTILTSVVHVCESTMGGKVNLRLRCSTGPNGTPIEMEDRRPVGRPGKQGHIPSAPHGGAPGSQRLDRPVQL
jgi:hypothetical protein